jgi:hypothetical protein
LNEATPAAPAPPLSPFRTRLRRLAIALCVPCIFYGVVGTGTTLVVWALVQFDPLRIDFHLSLLAIAAPAAFLARVLQTSRGTRVGSRLLAVALNFACIAFAALVALLRGSLLSEPSLAIVLAVLIVAPALNIAVMLGEPRVARAHAPARGDVLER